MDEELLALITAMEENGESPEFIAEYVNSYTNQQAQKDLPSAFSQGIQQGVGLVKSTPDAFALQQTLKGIKLTDEKLADIEQWPDAKPLMQEIPGYGRTVGAQRKMLEEQRVGYVEQAMDHYEKAASKMADFSGTTVPQSAKEAFQSFDKFGKFAAHSIGQILPMAVASMGTLGVGTLFMETGMVQMDMIEKLVNDPERNLTPEMIFEKALVDPDWAAKAGLVAASLDMISLGVLAKATGLSKVASKLIAKGGQELGEQAGKKVASSTLGKVGKSMAIASVSEAGTEGLQGQIEQYGAAKGSDTEFEWSWDQFWTEALAGGIGAAALGGTGSFISSKLQGDPKAVEEEDKKVVEEEEAKEITPEVALEKTEAIEETIPEPTVKKGAVAEIVEEGQAFAEAVLGIKKEEDKKIRIKKEIVEDQEHIKELGKQRKAEEDVAKRMAQRAEEKTTLKKKIVELTQKEKTLKKEVKDTKKVSKKYLQMLWTSGLPTKVVKPDVITKEAPKKTAPIKPTVKKSVPVTEAYEGGGKKTLSTEEAADKKWEDVSDYMKDKLSSDQYKGHPYNLKAKARQEAAKVKKENEAELKELKRAGWVNNYNSKGEIDGIINEDTGEVKVLDPKGAIKTRPAKKVELSRVQKARVKKEAQLAETKEKKEAKQRESKVIDYRNRLESIKRDKPNKRVSRSIDWIHRYGAKYPELVDEFQAVINEQVAETKKTAEERAQKAENKKKRSLKIAEDKKAADELTEKNKTRMTPRGRRTQQDNIIRAVSKGPEAVKKAITHYNELRAEKNMKPISDTEIARLTALGIPPKAKKRKLKSTTAFETKLPDKGEFVERIDGTPTLDAESYYDAANEAMFEDTQTKQTKVTNTEGKSIPIDAGLASFMTRIWELGLGTAQSDSGLVQDHKTKAKSRSAVGYIAFLKPNANKTTHNKTINMEVGPLNLPANTAKVINQITEAAKKVGLITKQSETAFKPSLSVVMRGGLTDKQVLTLWEKFTNELEQSITVQVRKAKISAKQTTAQVQASIIEKLQQGKKLTTEEKALLEKEKQPTAKTAPKESAEAAAQADITKEADRIRKKPAKNRTSDEKAFLESVDYQPTTLEELTDMFGESDPDDWTISPTRSFASAAELENMLTEADPLSSETIKITPGDNFRILDIQELADEMTRRGGDVIFPGLNENLSQLVKKLLKFRAREGRGTIQVAIAEDISAVTEEWSKSINGLQATNPTTGDSIILLQDADVSALVQTATHETIHPYFNYLMGSLLDGTRVGKQYVDQIDSIFEDAWAAVQREVHRFKRGHDPLNHELFRALSNYYANRGADYPGSLPAGFETWFEDDNNWGLYGFTNRNEFISEAFGGADFAAILNSININRKEEGIFSQQSVLYRIASVILNTLDKIPGIRIRKQSALGELSRVIAKLEQATNNPKVMADEINSLSKAYKKDGLPMGRITKLWAAIKDNKQLTSQEALKNLVSEANKNLPEDVQITKDEQTKLLEKFRKTGIEKKRKGLVGQMKDISDPRRFTTIKKNELVSKVEEQRRAILTSIHERLNKNHTPEELNAAEERYNTLMNKRDNLLINIPNSEDGTYEDGLSAAEQHEFEMLRFELAKLRSKAEMSQLVKELKEIDKKGRSLRREKLQKKSNRRKGIRHKIMQIVTGREDGHMPEEGTNEYDEAQKKAKSWYNKYRNILKKESTIFSSFHSLGNIISRFDKTATSDDSFFHREFGLAERKANDQKMEGIQSTNKEVMSKIFDIFMKDEMTPRQQRKLERGLARDARSDTPWVMAKLIQKFNNKLNKDITPINYIVEEGHEAAGEERTVKHTAGELMSIWMWMQDKALESNFIKNGYGADFRNEVNDFMEKNPKYKEMATWIQEEFIPKYYEKINATYRERNDMDLPIIPKYFPVMHDYADKNLANPEGVSLVDNHVVASINRRNTLMRKPNSQKLNFHVNALGIVQSHINNSEHYMAYDELVSDMRSVFGNKEVQAAINLNFSGEVNKSLRFFIDKFASENVLESVGSVALDYLRRIMYPILLGVNPVVYMKQASSSVAYAAHMPTQSDRTWGGMQSEALVPGTKAAKDKAWAIKQISEMPFMKKRAAKGARSLTEYETSPVRMFGEKVGNLHLADMAMWLVKKGDMAAIFQGGWPVYLEDYNFAKSQKMSDKGARDYARIRFMDTTLQTQQSTETADMSQFQLNRNVLFRFAAAFVTTPMQYARRVNNAGRAFARAAKRGDKKAMFRAGKQLFMYSTVLPMLFEAVNQGLALATTDDEDERKALLASLLYAPASSYLTGTGLVTHILEPYARREMIGEYFGGYQALYVSLIEDMISGMKAAPKLLQGEEITDKEAQKLANALGMWAKVPAGNMLKLATGTYDAITGQGDIRGAFGYSDWSLGKDRKVKYPWEEEKKERRKPGSGARRPKPRKKR